MISSSITKGTRATSWTSIVVRSAGKNAAGSIGKLKKIPTTRMRFHTTIPAKLKETASNILLVCL
jgi:hypothetical protein